MRFLIDGSKDLKEAIVAYKPESTGENYVLLECNLQLVQDFYSNVAEPYQKNHVFELET